MMDTGLAIGIGEEVDVTIRNQRQLEGLCLSTPWAFTSQCKSCKTSKKVERRQATIHPRQFGRRQGMLMEMYRSLPYCTRSIRHYTIQKSQHGNKGYAEEFNKKVEFDNENHHCFVCIDTVDSVFDGLWRYNVV